MTQKDPHNRQHLIESIYRIALEPQSYDDFIGEWDTFIRKRLDDLTTLRASTEEGALDTDEVAGHFTLAMQLLEQAGRPEIRDADTGTHPRMMVAGDGTLLWSNASAERQLGARSGMSIEDLKLGAQACTDILSLPKKTDDAVRIVQMPTRKGAQLPMAFRCTSGRGTDRLIEARQMRQHWPKATDALLEQGFGLSPSETAICAHIAAGRGASEIATQRDSAVGTVRTQIKRILQKTGCAGQVELVGLLYATMRLAERETIRTVPTARIPDRVLSIDLPGRTMPVETFGDPDGTPVIFFHGMLDGNTMTHAMRALLERHGFCLICPVRPHFGTAAPDNSGPIQTAPTRFARDIATLLDQTGQRDPILLGHMGGAIYAYAAAAHLGTRARGVLSVAGAVPLVSGAQFRAMSARQRVVALTARYTPQLLPFVVRAGISQLDNKGERQFMNSLYQTCPADLNVAADPDIGDLLFSGYRFTVAQGHRAFETDSYHVVRDWSASVSASAQPIELVHGVHDPVISYASVKAFHDRLGGRAQLTTMPESGQLICYTHPETVIAALERLRDTPVSPE
ncbi:alpha/beta hydrolase [Sulfitobacter albidus]|uniref:Alpha/beta hydrolase n=1 Tax=Sulfitobacter albidus TaxID=2829501 RepID=A0A975JGQ9_9RHOB|nr:alpha/beta hydrolase [Sulfitobacter albidus]QUJ78148.1 alpha/beta hydrolase [Sulfitobacter albidus]